MRRKPLLSLAAAAALGAALALALRMHEGLVLSNDIKSRCWPWAPTYAGSELSTQYLSDPVWQFVPWIELARREISEGRLPLWNPYQDGGVPLLGNGISALGSPLMLPALVLGVARGWNAMLILKALAAVAGGALWLRGRGRSPAAAALGGAAFGLSGAFIAWLEHPHTLVAAAIPFALFFAERLLERQSRGALLGLALATYALHAGGHPETALMAVLVGAPLVLSTRGRDGAAPRGGLARIALAGLAGTALAAPLLLPFTEYFLLSAARHGAERHPFVEPLSSLARFVMPGEPGSHPIEAAATVSLAALALAAAGLALRARGRETRAAVLVALAMLALVYDNPLARLAATATPVFWTRFLLLVPLPLGALAAAGLDALRDRARAAGRARAAEGIAWAFSAAAALELVIAARGTHAITRARELTPRTPVLDRLLADRDTYRVLPLHTFLPPNTASAFGLEDLRGYDALAPAGWRVVRGAVGRFRAVPTQTDVLEPWDLAPGGSDLDAWNVKYLLLHPQFQFGARELNARLGLDLEEVCSGTDGRLLRNRRALPRARWLNGGGEIAVLERGPTRWRFSARATAPGTLAVANPYFPGWTCTVDGAAVALAARPGEAISIPVPAGAHEVLLAYRPASFGIGLALALVSAGALAFALRRG